MPFFESRQALIGFIPEMPIMPGARSNIVIAGFDSFAAAESAAHALVAEGFREDAVSIFRINTASAAEAARPWPRRQAYAAMVNTVALAVAGAAVGVALATLVDIPDVLGVAAAAAGALAGGILGSMIAVLQGRSRRAALGTSHYVALVAVIAAGEDEAHGAQLLRDAGGIAVERMRGRFVRGNWASVDPLEGETMRRHQVSIQ